MPRRARVHCVSLRSSLVNLPISLYGPLVERSIRPQHLAVHLTLENAARTEVFVGWTGMASASSLAQFNSSDPGLETVEIDPQYASSLGLKQNDTVEIGLVHDLPLATSVATEPLTADDWEIIEIHASHVESTLLSQVRVAKVDQEIDVWVLGRTRVRLRVVSVSPESKGNALLLTTNTEVSISPKLHGKKLVTPARPTVNGVSSSTTHAHAPPEDPKTVVTSERLRVIRPQALATAFPEHSGSELLALVPSNTFTLLFPTVRPENDTYHRVSVKRLTPPTDPLASSSSDSPVPPPRMLKAGGTTETTSTGDSQPTELFIRGAESVPDGHIALLPVKGIDEWDLLRLSQSPETSKRSSPSKPWSPSPSSAHLLAGVDDLLHRCAQFCIRKFAMHSVIDAVHGGKLRECSSPLSTNKKNPVSSVLITGRSGSGKTSIVRSVAKRLQENSTALAYTLYVDVARVSNQPIPVVKALLTYWFEKAVWHRPTVLILDNLEKLVGAEAEHADSFRTRQITELFVALFSSSARSSHPNSKGVVLIATAASPASLHPRINRAHIFEETLMIKSPNKNARKEILAHMVQERLEAARDMQPDPDAPLNYAAIATQTEGYSAVDLQDLVARAIHQMAMRSSTSNSPAILTSNDFELAQVDFVPLSLRETKLQKSDVSWEDIGGLHETRRVLRETLEWPTKYGPIFAQSPLRLRSGLLLYGYPGCGKTLLASAVAKECGLNFISVKGPEILNKYIGASEQSVRDLFERASAAKPCILFFDEFDSIAPKRGHDSTGVTDRVVNQMLTQMDGAEGLDGVYVLAATSRPDLIDSALLRPGRLDKSLLCNMPDVEERKDVSHHLATRYNILKEILQILNAVSRKVTVSPDLKFDEIAQATEGFSGADLQALLYNAHLEVVHSSLSIAPTAEQGSSRLEEPPVAFKIIGGPANKVTSRADDMALQRRLRQIMSSQTTTRVSKDSSGSTTKPRHEITSAHITKVLDTMRPSVSLEERQRLDRIYRAFTSDRSGELESPPEVHGIGNRVSLA
ncbi:putative peroxisomal biogenesis AAA ATPase pex1 [Mycena indigotica]|uniref:Peroxisomal ATPase PEX1 n=1 Tax=Mycena indigotica TaxID=2126181 RepID=A0A8H6TD42_9AGAR|nr:putative peroxisomal biogenesis AAA ATPase pex1 [Mycena indigotica]KAF7315231.1 putative peroxisomal biogenesis AAA ATPase pex1 [Mycena indigotica]